MRLISIGYQLLDPDGQFGESTSRAIGRFQSLRGLRVTGTLDKNTWDTLVEAGYSLGDRMLYLKSPMFRGDDVAELQARLGSIGFDPGRVDGIFGERTSRALIDFQENVALHPDGFCGKETVTELLRVFGRSPEHVHWVKEREYLRSQTKTLSELLVAVTNSGEAEVPAEAISQRLHVEGIHVQTHSDPDRSALALLANRMNADVAIHLEIGEGDSFIGFYSGYSYVSPRGRTLAELLASELNLTLSTNKVSVIGLAMPILRETRMPAIVISLDSAVTWVKNLPEIAESVLVALSLFSKPVDLSV